MKLNIGIDVGNSDVKSSHTTVGSGYNRYATLPAMSQDYIKYSGSYYVSTQDKFPYVMDKTINEQCIVLTLFGIAKEILFKISKGKILTQSDKQKLIDRIEVINLGVGVPPMHCGVLSEKTKDYYKTCFGDILEFEYNGLVFRLKLRKIFVFPQDFSAVQNNPRCKIITEYPKCYAIDIGGYTVDVVTIVNGKPDLSICTSKELGVLRMYQQISNEILRLAGISVDNYLIECVLLGKKHTLPDNVVEIIDSFSADWCSKIINDLNELGVKFKSYPCVFIGGGSLLFKKHINRNSLVGVHEFLTDVHENAKGYERLLNVILSEPT